jgi:sulfur relay (sulfurtransferase) DsrF/TusC family protein
MAKILITISHAPFGHENAFAGLYVASASLSKGHEVCVILEGEGVYAVIKGQLDSQGNIDLPPIENQVKDILAVGGKVIVSKASLELRGIEQSALLENVDVLASEKIYDMILEHDGHMVGF